MKNSLENVTRTVGKTLRLVRYIYFGEISTSCCICFAAVTNLLFWHMFSLVMNYYLGVHLNAVDEDGFAALHWACANGQVDTARFLTGKGADVSVEGNQGETALLLAACFGFVDIVRLLLSMAAEVNHVDVVRR